VRFFLIFLALVAFNTVQADDFQTWTDVRIFYLLNPKWQLDGELGVRGIVSAQDWNRYYINPSASYFYRPNIILRGGMQWIYTHDKIVNNTFEIRPWQGARIIWPRTSYFLIDQYGRLEERLHFTDTGYSGRAALRFRYRFQAKSPNFRIGNSEQMVYFHSSLELFAEAGKTLTEIFADNRRIVFGMGYFITQTLRAEIHYIRQTSRQTIEEGYSGLVNILRLRIRYDWKK
jgi:hypothetical protein